jgi:hypothetical protein
MARIRSIKPEFWSSAQVMECPPVVRLLFIGIWNFCDDAGRMPWSPRSIQAKVFPGDDLAPTALESMLENLVQVGLIERYAVNGAEYFQVTGWQHQRINRPQDPKYPPPPSVNGHGSVNDHSVSGS